MNDTEKTVPPEGEVVVDIGETKISDLWKKEDYWAIWLGLLILIFGMFVYFNFKNFKNY